MMFRRKTYDLLKKWKEESNGATAILIEGARRVVKVLLQRILLRMNIKIIF